MNEKTINSTQVSDQIDLDSLDPVTKDLNVIRKRINMDAAFISEFKNGKRIFKYVNSNTPTSTIRVLDGDPLEETLCRLIVEEEIPAFIPDIESLEITKSAKSASKLNIRSYLGVPIRLSNGELYGTFCCYSHSPRWDLKDSDVESNMFAAITASRIEHELSLEKQNVVVQDRVQKMLDSNDLSIVYQPIFNISSGEVRGFEALSRFNIIHGMSPDIWFNDAAKVNLTVELEIKAIELALKALKNLPNHLYLSINSSAETILSNKLEASLEDHAFDKIVLEITEHQSIEQYEAINESLKPLRQKGLKLAVDDAGAGFASFRHILALAPEYIKIDISIIRNIHLDEAKQSLTKAFIAFAEQTNSVLVAEGVECAEELAILKNMGVENVQGYFTGRPEAYIKY